MSDDRFRQDLTGENALICGTDQVITPIPLYDGTGTTPLDLTGVLEIEFTLKKQLHPDWPVLLSLTKTAARVAIVGLATAGIISVTLQDTDTLPVSGTRLVGWYQHEIRVTDSGGLKSVVCNGSVEIKATAA